MLLFEARSIVEEVLQPLSPGDLFDAFDQNVLEARGSANDARARILGADPRQTVLNAFATHAPKLRYHGVTPTQPPPSAEAAPDESAFLALIERFHERDYTVRIPDVLPLSPALQRFARALECLLHQPVTALLF